MRRKRYNNPLHQALEIWNRLPQNSGHYFGLSLALDENLRIFQYHPGRLKLAPKQILTLPREGEGHSVYRAVHKATAAPVVFFLKSVSTLLGAHYWHEAGVVDGLQIAVVPRSGPFSVAGSEGVLLVDGEGLFAWGQDLEAVRDRVAELDFQLSYQIQLLSLPRVQRGPILDGGWRLPPLPQSRNGIYSL
ncbi:MAG: hypothetical protein KF760_20810 [Candidatus Eremiobacteraeota bacterium]|nr:hypothetical protein [Candidatus Eremiobacteraeota bacterium]MCW5871561.1 hypothetical protein [Candidatus Eremiobacteraeota bacterium]